MLKKLFIIILLIFPQLAHSNEEEKFSIWLDNFKVYALEKGISEKTIKNNLSNVRYIQKVIQYDRKQPEFFEDTRTYVKNRANNSRKNKANQLLKENENLLIEIEKIYKVEKEILLSLWGIETNFGKHVGKMDILSSLATLSYDKRRSKFFSKQLIILLKLIDQKIIYPNELQGSWAGAYGNFQFMPSTIKNYAIDYDNNNRIELKNSKRDSFASAANYINKIGWKYNSPCFYEVTLSKKVPKKYINISARNIKNRLTVKNWIKKGVNEFDLLKKSMNDKAALIIPDNNETSPIFLVFSNYEKILKWNRSLRFAISVCTLSNLIDPENVN